VINGTGFYIWDNKHTYEGTFLVGKMDGVGTYKWPDGGVYTGDYINNIKEGNGIFRWPNGREYKGQFSKGNPHGIGIITVQGKTPEEVEFINGRMNKNFKKSKTEAIKKHKEKDQKGNLDNSI
jgi:hypothetical protein